jgi:hypothetical protein
MLSNGLYCTVLNSVFLVALRRFKTETFLVRNMVLELVTKKLVKPVGGGLHEVAGDRGLCFDQYIL